MKLLEKKAKGKRESNAQNVSFSNLRAFLPVFPLCMLSSDLH